MGICRRLETPSISQAITADVNSDPIYVGDWSVLLAFISFATVTGGATSPTMDVKIDYLDDDLSTVLAFAAASFTQLTSAPNGAGVNVGPVSGSGFVLPNFVRVRFDVGSAAGTPSWNGGILRVYGRN